MARNATIGSGGASPNYSTIALWEASIDRASNGDETGTIVENKDFAEAVVINAATNGTDRIVLTVDDAYTHDGTKDSGARTKKTSGNYIFDVNTDYVTIEKLQIELTVTADRGVIDLQAADNGILISRCILIGGNNYSFGFYCRGVPSGEEVNVANCVAWECSVGFRIRETNGGNVYASYCSAFNCTTGIGFIGGASGTNHANGCVALGNTDDWLDTTVGATVTGDYNISGAASDAACPGANSDKGNETAASYFVDVTDDTDPDLHKNSSKDGSLDGGPSSGLGTYWPGGDIDGDTRSDWDIGADEIVGAATAGFVPHRNVYRQHALRR